MLGSSLPKLQESKGEGECDFLAQLTIVDRSSHRRRSSK